MVDTKTATRKAFMAAAWYSGLASLLSPFFAGIGAILMLHRVGAPRNPFGMNRHLTVEPAFLEAALANLQRAGYDFVTMDEAVERIASGGRGRRFLAVTLDDGYSDNLENAVPLFHKYRVPYTIYIAPGLTSGDADLWWELVEDVVASNETIRFFTNSGRVELHCAGAHAKRRAYETLIDHMTQDIDEVAQRRLAADLADMYAIDRKAHRQTSLLTWSQLRALVDDPLCTIGAHTLNHPMLKRIDDGRARFEIGQCASVIETELGARPRHFAYPYGSRAAVGPREVELAREAGYASAVTTRHGTILSRHASHLQSLPRISVNGRFEDVSNLRVMLSGVTVPAANRGRRFVTV